MEQSKKTDIIPVDAFRMSKYPVTNAQYQAFIDAPDGYQDERWWNYAPHILQWHKNNPKPIASAFPGDSHPRNNITWYEAMAFCKWISTKTGLPITLPNEEQWVRAAQGDSPRLFPWGKRFDPSRCNTRESGLRSTTPVNCYEGGISPYGIYDMTGNVWEWCLTWRKDNSIGGEVGRMVRGGSFVSPQDRSDISSYFILKPIYRYTSIGFRLVNAI
jgi:formylglycine-generating enzyme required for sulfatase activity